MDPLPWVAHKVGGSSLADAGCMRQVASLLLARRGERQVIVVSAMRGVTDELLAVANLAVRADGSWPRPRGRLAALD